MTTEIWTDETGQTHGVVERGVLRIRYRGRTIDISHRPEGTLVRSAYKGERPCEYLLKR